MKSFLLTAGLAFLAQVAPSLGYNFNRRPRGMKQHKHPNMNVVTNGTFDQLLDHQDPSKGTFSQRYWYDAQYWNGPGSPVFLFNVGESSADGYTGYLHNMTITGYYAQKFGGAVIVIEHRYWGESNPYPDNLTTETLQYLDLPQSVWDMTYFAKNVKLEAGDETISNADEAPWVFVGGSYPGALAGWISRIDPGVFWAYHASSAVVEAIYDFYGYFDAIARGMPKGCSDDVKAVIQHVDGVFNNGTESDIQDLKETFGLGVVEHPEDFAAQLAGDFFWWQSNETKVFEFCDYIESYASGKAPSSKDKGVGLKAAMAGYASWVKETSDCTEASPCNSYDPKNEYNNVKDDSGDRQWLWMLCHNPFAWWQVGPPTNDGTTIVSSLLTPEHSQRDCALEFPTTNGFQVGSVEGFTVDHLNMYTGGWDADFERVMFVNGEFDPWLAATVSSTQRPGGPRQATKDMPIYTVKGGNHVPDFFIDDDPAVANVTTQQIATMKRWLSEWKASA
ncbi:hypothetical protein GQ53DRAFT_797563 [Thozetella sp. PMI_491]|nr:hypothetical protein GQ53DRAFT_797563 [Thozetella sp. PMI_491]